jgi:Mn-dependent DtxR family transcriptional regulator
MTEFYEDDLLEEIRKYSEEPDEPDNEPGTITTRELSEVAEVSYRAALKLGKRLCADGVLEYAQIGRVTNWGRLTKVAGYRYIGAKHDPPSKSG